MDEMHIGSLTQRRIVSKYKILHLSIVWQQMGFGRLIEVCPKAVVSASADIEPYGGVT